MEAIVAVGGTVQLNRVSTTYVKDKEATIFLKHCIWQIAV